MTIETSISAAADRCFDAARDMDLHVRSVAHTNERVVAGRSSGLIGLGETVTFRARHFGIVQSFTSKITEFHRPTYFQDRMTKGSFRSFVHDHRFVESLGQTTMTDTVEFRSPLGLLGRLVDKLVLTQYLGRLLRSRATTIKSAAESIGA
ncbi:MAG: SRPBCC family protein [Thermoanaerobaculia bacterium]